MRKTVLVLAVVLCAASVPTVASAKSTPHAQATSGDMLFGDAALVHPGHASSTSAQATSTGTYGYGGVDFSFSAGLTVSGLTNLATDYRFVAGSCALGSPRFVATVTNGTSTGNIFFYIGPPPQYTGCASGVWANTGNLATSRNLVDDSQLPGGTFYDTYSNAQANYGTYTVTDIFLVVDGPSQTVDFDNSQINSDLFTYQ